MSTLETAIEAFANGGTVLVGDVDDRTALLATAAPHLTPDRLEQLHEMGRGMVVLGIAHSIARRLGLRDIGSVTRHGLELNLMTPVDAARGITGGWSWRDQATTMIVAADPESSPNDLVMPGHVHPACVDEPGRGPITAAVELAMASEGHPAVAVCTVVDRRGRPVPLEDAQSDDRIARLPIASAAQLHGHAIGRSARELAVSCFLPTRAGDYRAVAFATNDSAAGAIALVRGELSAGSCPLVHVHVACLTGDVFGSLRCNCKAELNTALASIESEEPGIIVYAKPQEASVETCSREEPIDVELAAGMLHRLGVRRLRLFPPSRYEGALRACGFEVQA